MANANIFQQFLKEPPSAMDYADRFAARDTSRQQNALNQLVIGEKVRGIEDQNRLRQLYSQNPNLTADELRRQGFRDEAAKVDSAALESRKTESEIGLKSAQTSKAQAEAQAKAADIAYEKAQRHAQGIGSVNTPEDIVAYIDAGIQNGVPGFTVENRQKFIDNANSAGSVEEWKKKAIAGSIPVVERFKADADMKRAQLQADTQIKTTGMNNATQIKTTGMNNAVTLRGQNVARDTALQGGSVQALADGTMIVVPNKVVPGQPTQVSPVMVGGQPAKKAGEGPKISAEVQRQIGGVMDFDKTLSALEDALKDFNPRGMDQLNVAKRAKISSLAKQAQLSAKEAAALGALTGPDMALIEGVLANPVSYQGAVIGNKGLTAQIAEARAGNKRRVKTLSEQYGDKAVERMPANLRDQPAAAGGLSADEAAELAELKKRFSK